MKVTKVVLEVFRLKQILRKAEDLIPNYMAQELRDYPQNPQYS